jgi:hypothetical protein
VWRAPPQQEHFCERKLRLFWRFAIAYPIFLQSCFVLHGAGAAPKEEVQQASLPMILEDELQCCGVWRMQAFNIVWGRLETLAQVGF